MREIARIDRIIAQLTRLAVDFPDAEFFDLVLTILNHNVFFYLEDAELEQVITNYETSGDSFKKNAQSTVPTTKVLMALQDLWKKVPDQRFTQLLCNIFVGLDYATEYYKDVANDMVLMSIEDTYKLLK